MALEGTTESRHMGYKCLRNSRLGHHRPATVSCYSPRWGGSRSNTKIRDYRPFSVRDVLWLNTEFAKTRNASCATQISKTFLGGWTATPPTTRGRQIITCLYSRTSKGTHSAQAVRLYSCGRQIPTSPHWRIASLRPLISFAVEASWIGRVLRVVTLTRVHILGLTSPYQLSVSIPVQ